MFGGPIVGIGSPVDISGPVVIGGPVVSSPVVSTRLRVLCRDLLLTAHGSVFGTVFRAVSVIRS